MRLDELLKENNITLSNIFDIVKISEMYPAEGWYIMRQGQDECWLSAVTALVNGYIRGEKFFCDIDYNSHKIAFGRFYPTEGRSIIEVEIPIE